MIPNFDAFLCGVLLATWWTFPSRFFLFRSSLSSCPKGKNEICTGDNLAVNNACYRVVTLLHSNTLEYPPENQKSASVSLTPPALSWLLLSVRPMILLDVESAFAVFVYKQAEINLRHAVISNHINAISFLPFLLPTAQFSQPALGVDPAGQKRVKISRTIARQK